MAVNFSPGVCWLVLTISINCLLPSYSASDIESMNTLVDEGNELLDEFYSRYNATKEVDLVFVLDRSGSVPAEGWASILEFVEKVLEHFTVDEDNTRVAMVTFATTASVDINDLDHNYADSSENKCTLYSRIRDRVETKVPHGYTATTDALQKTYNILLNSRSNAKKAVLVLTDGKSNIGSPPVKIAFDILSLRWDVNWDINLLGPQVEIYAFGIQNAYMPELKSMASSLPHHVFLIPKFSLFADFARSLHGGLQEENWLPAHHNRCGQTCNSTFTQCMCGSKIGLYQCVCSPGYEMLQGECTPCPRDYYKDNFRPEKCEKCPENSTTKSIASVDRDLCQLLPGHQVCSPAPQIEHGTTFQVTGTRRDEVLNTGVPCVDVNDGNSCHYECDEGYRLTGPPVLSCNHTGLWQGDVPECQAIDCYEVESTFGIIHGVTLSYPSNHTLYKAEVLASCLSGRVPLPDVTSWSCDKHGRWTVPENFECVEIFCPPFQLGAFMKVFPETCSVNNVTHGSECSLGCQKGFELDGEPVKTCSFSNKAVWTPVAEVKCKDVESPTIICPYDVEVTVPNFNQAVTKIYPSAYQNPLVNDNSGSVDYVIQGVPDDGLFLIGVTVLRYIATDPEGNSRNCTQNVMVLEKTVDIRKCPQDINVVGRSSVVTWEDPEFVGPDGLPMKHACTRDSGSTFSAQNEVVCYPVDHADIQCRFNVTVQPVPCPMPDAPPPAHGSLVCAGNELLQRVCRVMCEKGWTMPDLTSREYRCTDIGTWQPELGTWPSCADTGWGRNVLIAQSMHIRYTGSCRENMDTISAAFTATMEQILTADFGPCQQPHQCSVQKVVVVCGDPNRRRRGVANGILEKPSELLHEVSFRAWRPEKGHHRVRRADPGFDIEFDLSIENQNTSAQGEQARLISSLLEVMTSLEGKVSRSEVQFEVGDETAFADTVEQLAELPEFPLNCTERQLPLVDTSNPDDMSARCVTCAPGTYMNDGRCDACPLNTYQDGEGQSECKSCPPGTATPTVGSCGIRQCRAPCTPGTSSRTGHEPCSPCPRGQHQPMSKQTSCQMCPDNTTTSQEGTTNASFCGESCPSNTHSRTGLAPCTECPPGTYQPYPGQRTCIVCDYDRPSELSERWCPEPVNCTIWGTACKNGFCVLSRTNYTVCRCDAGYHGDACELNINDCKPDSCDNGGTCLDDVDGYTCACPSAFTGPRCDHYIGPCSSEPCLNNASCINNGLDFLCVCRPGYNGTVCDVRVDPCYTRPCLNGQCNASLSGFTCNCDSGFAGFLCEKRIDHCIRRSPDVTCLNGGTCTSETNSLRCACTGGFTGERCDKSVDYCTPDPCEDRGRCVSLRTGYSCVCQNGFYGRQCEMSANPNFDLTFKAGLFGYAELSLVHAMREVSVCLWLRTKDKTHHGTILSYTAESNWMNTDYLDVFTLYDYSNLQIIINGDAQATNIALNDGNWHHLCVTWSGEHGAVHVYVNSTLRASGLLAPDSHLEAGGNLVIGQRQLGRLTQYFDSRQSFVGSVSRLNIHDYILDNAAISYLANRSYCVAGEGNIMAWSSVLSSIRGDISLTSLCLDEDECLTPGTCGDDQFCVDKTGGYQCLPCPSAGCPGDLSALGACHSSPCNNHGTCLSHHDNFSCICPPEYTGRTCEQLNSTCGAIRCQNGGTCTEDNAGVYCACPQTWRGRYCHVKYIASCAQRPCLNNGVCLERSIGGYMCQCPEDSRFYGPNCEVLTACQALPSPCIDGATCVVLDSGNVTCLCPIGYDSDNCFRVPVITTPADYCQSAHCQNGGTCVNMRSGFQCHCTKQYSGMYCENKRKLETREYEVSVSLDMLYTPSLKQDEVFKQRIKKQVHNVYANEIGDSKLRVDILDIRSGSVEVDMLLHHSVYIDAMALAPGDMKALILTQLQTGALGDLPASTHNFKFNYKAPVTSGIVMYALIAVAVVIVIVIVIVFILIVRKRRQYSPNKLNNMPMCDINRELNPAFVSDSAPPTPRMRHIQEDNIYDDLSEPSPYAIDCSGKDSDLDLTKRFPSKNGRDINKDWASLQRQSIPLPPKPGEMPTSNGREDGVGYLQACRGQPPPSYKDVHLRDARERYGQQNLNVDSEYMLPSMSAEEERYGLDMDLYLKPSEIRKDNISKAKGLHVYINTRDPDAIREEPQPTYLPLLPNTPEGACAAEPSTDARPEQTDSWTGTEQELREDSPDYLLLNEEVPVSNFEAPKPIIRTKKTEQPASPEAHNPPPIIDDSEYDKPIPKPSTPTDVSIPALDEPIPLSPTTDTVYAIGGDAS